MISIACSGFPVPVSRYFHEFRAVEVSDTELGIPGVGTLRRWLREAPPEFVFTALAPKQIAAAGFVLDPSVEQVVDAIAGFAKELGSRAVVFAASDDYVASRKSRTQLRDFAKHIAKRVPHPVLDLPGWSRKDVSAALGTLPIAIAFDPLNEQPDDISELAYLRLPGPSGYRSRYDTTALTRVVACCEQTRAKHTFVAFRNIDRFENARFVMGKLGLT
ncbi:MAG: DUF72 domain-containing protein [Polyangiales bacterium]